ncbi:hypothetical protein [Butyrivibrio sp. AE3004]|uniref:hypothetical protein n=1 Tax=Butyrivibrio sp. AE3004 TaxID=1506994 RepID=UPI00049454EA|nr:hypothetical protein [Butyrivibrio sp. AE3004]
MKNRLVYLIGACVALMALCACGEKNSSENDFVNVASVAAKSEDKILSKANTTTENSEKNDDASYKEVYSKLIDELSSEKKADMFALINVDEDSVPELAAVDSEGSWDEDQVFLYTTDGKDAILLASDIGPGMEGHAVSYFEKKNVIVQTGAPMGDRYVLYKIVDSKPVQFLAAEQFEMIDEEDNEVVHSIVDDKEVSEEEYLKMLKAAFPEEEMIMLSAAQDAPDMVRYKVSLDNGYLDLTETEKIPYSSYDEIMELLK